MASSVIRQSSTKPDTFGGFSADQLRAILILAQGGTVTQAADSIGVHRSTIYVWVKQGARFKQAVEEIRRERLERVLDQMRELEALALTRLRHILEDASVPAAVQLRAATLVLNRPSDGSCDELWRVPIMECLENSLKNRPTLATPPRFDILRQLSTPPVDSAPAQPALTLPSPPPPAPPS